MKKIILTLFFLISIVPVFTFAQPQTGPTGPTGPIPYQIKISSPLKFCDDTATGGAQCTLPGLITVIIDNLVIPIGAVLAVLTIIYAGFLFVTARGDSAQITKAREALLYAIIGSAILLGAKLLASAIQATVLQLR